MATCPQGDDPLDDVAAHQRGIALLQQLEKNNPDLWALVTTLPDGIRSAVALPPPPVDPLIARFTQAAMFGAVQMPLTSPAAETGLETPMDAPGQDETVVLLEQGGARLAYAVDAVLQARHITLTQFVRALSCEPDTPAEPLPRDTNRRVMTAFGAAQADMASRLGKERRPTSDTRLRRYLNRQFQLLREQHKGNDEELKRIGILQQIFPDASPPRAAEALDGLRRMDITGDSLLRRLEALRQMYRLNPPGEEGGGNGRPVGVLRIVCSDGLV